MIALPCAMERLPRATASKLARVSANQARKDKKRQNDARKADELGVAKKISATRYKEMKVLQLRGWTLTEIAKFLKVPRSSVVWELYFNTILER
jgi:hypothetical protein